MSKIKFTMKFTRIATIRTTKGNSPVGTVEEFHQNPDGSLDLVVAFNPDIDKDLQTIICKNPGVLGIMSTSMPINDAVIIE